MFQRPCEVARSSLRRWKGQVYGVEEVLGRDNVKFYFSENRCLRRLKLHLIDDGMKGDRQAIKEDASRARSQLAIPPVDYTDARGLVIADPGKDGSAIRS